MLQPPRSTHHHPYSPRRGRQSWYPKPYGTPASRSASALASALAPDFPSASTSNQNPNSFSFRNSGKATDSFRDTESFREPKPEPESPSPASRKSHILKPTQTANDLAGSAPIATLAQSSLDSKDSLAALTNDAVLSSLIDKAVSSATAGMQGTLTVVVIVSSQTDATFTAIPMAAQTQFGMPAGHTSWAGPFEIYEPKLQENRKVNAVKSYKTRS
jgi:hypothetical protein